MYSDNLCMLPSVVHMPSLVRRQAAVQESNCVFAVCQAGSSAGCGMA